MAEYDVTASGTYGPTILGLNFFLRHLTNAEAVISGTGVYTPFLHIDENGPTTIGFNTDDKIDGDYTDAGLDISDSSTNAITLGEIPILYLDLTDDGIDNVVAYYEIRLDDNEPNTDTSEVSLEALQLFTSDSEATIANYQYSGYGSLAFGSGFDIKFDIDSTGDNRLRLEDTGSGSGRDDYIFYIPVSVLGSDSSQYLTVFSQFGPSPAEDGGFEEFRVQTASKIDGYKFNDHDGQGDRDAGVDGALEGFTIYIDQNNNNVLDAGEMYTKTDANGYFAFYSVLSGEKLNGNNYSIRDYTIREVLSEADLGASITTALDYDSADWLPENSYWTQTTDPLNDGDQVVHVGAPGTYSTLVGNHELTPVLLIDKQFTGWEDGDTGDNKLVGDTAGDIAHYSIVVTNDGQVDLTGVVVTDPLTGLDELVGDLAAGTFTVVDFTYVLTQADIDSNATLEFDNVIPGFIDNTATADSDQTGPVSDTEQAPIDQNPAIAIVKDHDDSDDCVEADDKINYTYTVTNTGNVALKDVTVVDNKVTVVADDADLDGYNDGDTDTDGLLDVNETWTYTASYTVTQDDVDTTTSIDNHVTADGNAAVGGEAADQASDDDTVELCREPAIAIVKEAALEDKGDCIDEDGDVVNYTYTVTNIGNVALAGVTVVDDRLGPIDGIDADLNGYNDGDTDEDGLLDVTETWTFAASYTASQDDIDNNGDGNGFILNIATANGVAAVGGEAALPASDDASVEVCQLPAIDLEKYVDVGNGFGFVDADYTPPAGFPLGPQNVNVGDPVTFRITLDNIGNTSLTNVVITDTNDSNGAVPGTTVTLFENGDLTAAALALGATLTGDTGDDGILGVDETWTLEYTTAFDAGQHTNTAVVTTDEDAGDTDNAAYYSLVDNCPGVRTPGFWYNWQNLWDGTTTGDPKQLGKPGFPTADLLYAVDSNNDGVINASDQKGLLIGDWDKNGLNNEGDAFFLKLSDAASLVGVKEGSKTMSDGVVKLGRDAVATWLNYLQGSSVGDAGDVHSPHHLLDEAIDFLQTFGGTKVNATGTGFNDFYSYNKTHTAVKMTDAAWTTDPDGAGTSLHAPSALHNNLDEYNNSGTTFGGVYEYCHDGDDALANAALLAISHI